MQSGGVECPVGRSRTGDIAACPSRVQAWIVTTGRKDLQTLYLDLVMRRKVCVECSGLENPALCCDGRYDCDHIGPWTLWQGNIGSELMVIGQDWGDTKYFAKNYGRDGADNPTNRNLRHLLVGCRRTYRPPTAGRLRSRLSIFDERNSVSEEGWNAGCCGSFVVCQLRNAISSAHD